MTLSSSRSFAPVVAAAFFFAASSLGPSPADARSFRVSQVPNGGELSCQTCHVSRGGPRSLFGLSVEFEGLSGPGGTSSQSVDWALIYQLDSDGDGFTNGAELGDPDGTWVIGDPNPPGPVTHPGDDSDCPTCGEEEDVGMSNDDVGPAPADAGMDAGFQAPDAGETDADTDSRTIVIVPQDDGEGDEGCSSARSSSPASAPLALLISALAFARIGVRRRNSR